VLPSRQDNLPNTGGLPDIVADRVTNALVEPFELVSLAAAIRWMLEDAQRRRALAAAARERAERLWALERGLQNTSGTPSLR